VNSDDPESLANGILTIYRDPNLARELSANGVRGVREHYSAARMADRALEAYTFSPVRETPLQNEPVVSTP
jgi:glycosyltransferase involved in cell wall biosynthesis